MRGALLWTRRGTWSKRICWRGRSGSELAATHGVHRSKRRPIKLLIADREIRVLDRRTGELIRELTLDPSRDYQPIGGG